MQDKIQAALKGLDARNNDHWTAEGLPSLKALGIEGVKRADVTAVAPHFTRDNLVIETPDEKAKEEAVATAAELAEKAKEELGTIEEQKVKLKIIIDQKTLALQHARADLEEAVANLDKLLHAEFVAGAARKPIHDIMDFVAAQQKQREAKIEAALKGK